VVGGDKLRKPFFSQEKKGFRAFQRKANIAEEKSIDFSSARGMKLQLLDL